MPNNKVEKLKPGSYLLITPDRFENVKYWDLSGVFTDKSLNSVEVKQELEYLVSDAVKIRSDRRFKASAHVSGGLDSGIVAALARKEYANQPEFYGFSWTPDYYINAKDIIYDERPFINKICEQNNISPVYTGITSDNFYDWMASWRNFSELIYEKKVTEEANKKGINLIFSGWGGDEFISNNSIGIDRDLFWGLNWYHFLLKNPIWQPKRFLSSLFFNVMFPKIRSSFVNYKASLYDYQYIKDIVGDNLIQKNIRFRYDSRRNIHLQLLKGNHIAARTDDWYVLGQRSGIEYRYPLLDKRIIEYMIKVPSRCLVESNTNRIILRNLGKNFLPAEVIENKSKNDPVRILFLNRVLKQTAGLIYREMERFRSNPDLDFINFDLVEKNFNKDYDSGNLEEEENICWFLFNIKHAHDFTKGYYDSHAE